MANHLISAVSIASIFVTAGLGLYILTGLCGQVSLAQGAYMAIGASFFSYLARTTVQDSRLGGQGLVFVVAFAIAVLSTAVVSSFFGWLTIRLKGASAISASIAVSIIVLYLIERAEFLSGGSRGATSPDIIAIGNTDFLNLVIGSREFEAKTGLMILITLITISVLFYIRNVSNSPLARYMRTVREIEFASQTCAVSPTRTIVSAHFICGLCAGIAGALYAPILVSFEISSSNPWLGPFGIVTSMQILTFLVVSGMKRYWITVFILFLLPFISQIISEYSSSATLLNSVQDGIVSPSQMTAIVSSFFVLIFIYFRSRLMKKKL